MKRRRDERAARDEIDRMTDEAESILRGRIVERGEAGRIPGWVRLNELGHGDWASLTGVAQGVDLAQTSSWDGAVRFLAGELVTRTGTPKALVELQRQSIIPLELDLLAGGRDPATPAELVQLVRDQLVKTSRSAEATAPLARGHRPPSH